MIMRLFRICIFFAGILIPVVSSALPRFALLRGEANCLACHVNPTGGMLRNEGGESYSINTLPMWKRGDKFSGQISDGIRIGADYRNQFLSFSETHPTYHMAPRTDTLGTEIVKGGDTTESNSGFHAMSLSLYIDATLTPSVHAYLHYDPLANKVDGYGLLNFVSPSGDMIESGNIVTNAHFKFGAFMPAFGIRFDDHTVYVRGGNRNLSGFGGAGFFWIESYRDIGAELGGTFADHFSAQLGLFNGFEENQQATFPFIKQDMAVSARVTASNEFIEDMFSAEIGYSMYSRPRKDQTGSDANVSIVGIHGGVRVGFVTLLAEYDKGENVYRTVFADYAPKMQALTTELALNITRGLDGIVRYETYKDADQANNTQIEVKNRISIGAQWFPLRMVEIRPEFRIAKQEQPSSQIPGERESLTDKTFLVQMHLFF
jgi:hypothetical protein